MSTTFEVYPGNEYIPLFSELLYDAEKEVNGYLRGIDVHKNIKLNAELQTIAGHIKTPVQSTSRLKWEDSFYAWFYIKGIPGGTDVYFYKNDELYIDFLSEELERNPNFKKYGQIVNDTIKLGYHWTFRRSAGQPAMIALCYGFLAAALAKLTGGVLHTDDGAWDYGMFPADPDEFIKWYFRPEYAARQEDADFAGRCIASIKNVMLSNES